MTEKNSIANANNLRTELEDFGLLSNLQIQEIQEEIDFKIKLCDEFVVGKLDAVIQVMMNTLQRELGNDKFIAIEDTQENLDDFVGMFVLDNKSYVDVDDRRSTVDRMNVQCLMFNVQCSMLEVYYTE